jgi:hypothetical protein
MIQISADVRCPSPQPGPAAALAFYDFVALLDQPLAFAILALLLLLDVGASFIGHGILSAVMFTYSHEGRILDYKQDLFQDPFSKTRFPKSRSM